MACNSDFTSNILDNVTNIKQQSTGPFTLNGKNYATLQDAVNALSSKGTKGISSTNTIYLNKDTA